MSDDRSFDDEKNENGDRDSVYGTVPSEESPHTKIDTSQINPQGTGCRTCFILVLLVGAVLAFYYFYYQDRIQTQPTPANNPPGQMQGN